MLEADQAADGGTTVRLQPETAALLEVLIRDLAQQTGEHPEADEVLRTALEALRAARVGETRKAGVVAKLLELGKKLARDQIAVGKPSFAEDPAANDLVISDGFAFLLAVIFDQSIRAERAWAAPFELKLRLGHLDPKRMVLEPDRVERAIQEPPTLHRYVEKVPKWVVSAARRVIEDYSGDASAIWSDQPTAAVLHGRLDAFDGIGQKKAAMAVEILERDLRVPIKDLQGSDIAYDVHVRRVFLRTGLALFDDPVHMIGVAREVNVARPGAVDFPAWTVGRNW